MINQKVKCNNFEIGNDKPFTLIAGPCQLENEKHAIKMSTELKKITSELGINLIYKTSFDKANRTSLSGKRGLGLDKSLPIFDKIKKEDLFSYFKGISIGLVSMCTMGLSIGYYCLDEIPKILISIPIFFIPLWLIILMLHAKGIFYKTSIFSSCFYLFFLYPHIENLSIILAGFLSACTGFIVERLLKK